MLSLPRPNIGTTRATSRETSTLPTLRSKFSELQHHVEGEGRRLHVVVRQTAALDAAAAGRVHLNVRRSGKVERRAGRLRDRRAAILRDRRYLGAGEEMRFL